MFEELMIQKQNFDPKNSNSEHLQAVNLDSNCRITQENNKRLIETAEANCKYVTRVCRVCLQSQTTNISLNPQIVIDNQSKTNPIINLPCACKNELGMIHENCIKFWVKVWIQSKMNSQQNDEAEPEMIRRQHPIPNGLQNEQRYLQDKSDLADRQLRMKIKPLRFKKLKERHYYPFPCQICHHPIYFDLFFNYRLKSSSELTKKDLILFIMPLFFTVIFLGICVNWMVQTGVNMYLILFYSLVWVPLFVITVAIGIVTFSKKEFWVKGVYSKEEIRRISLAEVQTKMKKINKQNDLKQQQFFNFKKKIEQFRGKYFDKAQSQKAPKAHQDLDAKNPNINPLINTMKPQNENLQNFPQQIHKMKEKQKSEYEQIQLQIQEQMPGSSNANLHQEQNHSVKQ